VGETESIIIFFATDAQMISVKICASVAKNYLQHP
jgi:hypothetical protein